MAYNPPVDKEGTKEGHLSVDMAGLKVLIPETELVPLVYDQSSLHYVGGDIRFVITEYIPEINLAYASQKMAMDILQEPVLEKLLNGETMVGLVAALKDYGAFVSISGVRGLLRNEVFSDSGVAVKDIYKVGDKIRVNFLRYSENGLILLAPEEVYSTRSAFQFEDLRSKQIVLGKVVNIHPDRVYVNILPGIDVMCPTPEYIYNLSVNEMVQVRIGKIDQEKRRVRGIVVYSLER